MFVSDESIVNHVAFLLLPNDYQSVLRRCSKFMLGIYVFGIYQQMECRDMGPYIVVATAYYGNGSYASWNYYTARGTYGKRIDDVPCKSLGKNKNCYVTFTDMLQSFLKDIGRYYVRKGSITSDIHTLPFS